MKSKFLKEADEDLKDFDIWGQIIKKLEENGKTVDWLSEQVPQGKKTFYWFYYRKRIKTDMLMDVSRILKHNFFEYCSEFVERALAKKRERERTDQNV